MPQAIQESLSCAPSAPSDSLFLQCRSAAENKEYGDNQNPDAVVVIEKVAKAIVIHTYPPFWPNVSGSFLNVQEEGEVFSSRPHSLLVSYEHGGKLPQLSEFI